MSVWSEIGKAVGFIIGAAIVVLAWVGWMAVFDDAQTPAQLMDSVRLFFGISVITGLLLYGAFKLFRALSSRNAPSHT